MRVTSPLERDDRVRLPARASAREVYRIARLRSFAALFSVSEFVVKCCVEMGYFLMQKGWSGFESRCVLHMGVWCNGSTVHVSCFALFSRHNSLFPRLLSRNGDQHEGSQSACPIAEADCLVRGDAWHPWDSQGFQGCSQAGGVQHRYVPPSRVNEEVDRHPFAGSVAGLVHPIQRTTCARSPIG